MSSDKPDIPTCFFENPKKALGSLGKRTNKRTMSGIEYKKIKPHSFKKGVQLRI